MKDNHEKNKWHQIPIYGVWLELTVSDNMKESRSTKHRRSYLGEIDDDVMDGAAALHCHCDAISSIFFERKHLKHDVIAHEVSHSAVFIMGRCGIPVRPGNDEAYCHLVQYITGVVYSALEKWKERVTIS